MKICILMMRMIASMSVAMKFLRSFLFAACGIFALPGEGFALDASPVPAGKKPNIILFLVDDMGWQDTSVPFWTNERGDPEKTFLNKHYRTPNMEKLAARGMTFTDAYAHPLCTPQFEEGCRGAI